MAGNADSIVNPVVEDGKSLIAAFAAKQSVTFADFVDSWNDMKFFCVYW